MTNRPLGKRIVSVHRTAAIMLFNTVLLLVIVELMSGALLAVVTSRGVRDLLYRTTGRPNDLVAHHYLGLPYYAEHEWSTAYWREHTMVQRQRYSPYVIWRSPGHAGDLINIDDGLRVVPDTHCTPGALRVYAFGGSAMWGWGSPDWGTIPAYLQTDIEEVSERSVCVVNYGENAYVSTQSLFQLELLLKSGDVPDVVLFYDGVNEVFAADQTQRPAVHQNLSDIAGRFESSRSPLAALIQQSASYRLLQLLASQLGGSGGGHEASAPETDPAGLSDAVVDTYLKNYEIVRSLSETFGFEFHFFWQPHILAGEKPMTEEEQNMLTGLGWVVDLTPELRDLFVRTYGRIEEEASTRESLHYLGHAFDDASEQIWIDTWGHVTPDGNRLISQAIASHITAR